MTKAYLKAISYYLPERVITNEDLEEEFPEWNVSKISAKVGIIKRHKAEKKETAVDMALRASERLIEEHSLDKSVVDFVLLCTQTPDYILPTSACLIQDRLELSTKCGALDFNLGCSGYVYGLSLAKGLIVSGVAKNVLLITSETYSKHIHPKDKGNKAIFGDAATASLISTEGLLEIDSFSLGTDGSGAENLIIKTGGSREPKTKEDLVFDDSGNPHSSDYLYMNGSEIFNFTLENVPILIEETLQVNNLKLEEINLFVFHQANKFIMNALRKKIGIKEDVFFYYLENVGNTVSSSIPIALYEAKKVNRLEGNTLLAGFGVGYSWGGVVLRTK